MVWIDWTDSTGDQGSARWGNATDEQIESSGRWQAEYGVYQGKVSLWAN
jgi:hypothetical protein